MALVASVYARSAVSPFPTPLPCTGFKQGRLTDESHPETCWSCTRLDQGSDTRTPQRSRCGGDQGMPHLGMRCYSAFQIRITLPPIPANSCQILPVSGTFWLARTEWHAISRQFLPNPASFWHVLAAPNPAAHIPATSCQLQPNPASFWHVLAERGASSDCRGQEPRAAGRRISTIDMEPGEIGS